MPVPANGGAGGPLNKTGSGDSVHADLIQMEREEIEVRDAQMKAGASRMQGGNLVIEP